ncbi:TIGR00730 family Rossman fold protein [Shimia ponticola]|uniref:LOG family protein n=1 Tax=Shimia ponticola TaxID=2582893 RepID=UPI0011BF08AB|nr:TIGR00730 family Rossman fold protein [Shimia ponticola]
MAQIPFSVCVFCGSRSGRDPECEQAAKDFGSAMGGQGWRLVYGAGDVGLMGTVAKAAQDAGAQTFGVIPQHLVEREIGKYDLDSYVVTETMHERKKVMFMNADAIVVLPGGAGSLDEFFEVLTWAQIGLHNKPIVLVNVGGYWNPLIDLIKHTVDHGFAGESVMSLFSVADSSRDAIAMLDQKATQ